mgnify:CR=1 FL=1
MRFFNWSFIRLLLMFALVIFLYSFARYRNDNRKLTKSEVIFLEGDNLFVKNEMVNKLLIENKRDASSIQKDKLDLNKLEKSINSNPMIEKSEVFSDIVVARLNEIEFETFLENENGVRCYIKAILFDKKKLDSLVASGADKELILKEMGKFNDFPISFFYF